MLNDSQIIEAWRDENRDDDQNHNFVALDDHADHLECKVCGDNEEGLLHAFDPQFPEGYFDEVILEVMYNA